MTNDEIRDLALSHGFTIRSQPDGAMDLNPYVYAFARALIKKEREACAVTAWSAGMQNHNLHRGMPCDAREAGAFAARAIRARGES